MFRNLTLIVALVTLMATAAGAQVTGPVGGEQDIPLVPQPAPAKPDPDAVKKMKEAFAKTPLILTATVTLKVVGQTNSMPPHQIIETTLSDVKMIKGKLPKNLAVGSIPGVISGDTAIIASEAKDDGLGVLWAQQANVSAIEAANAAAGATSKPATGPADKAVVVADVTIPDVETFNKLLLSPILVTGKVTGLTMGPMAMSEPPIYSLSFALDEAKAIRGELPKDAKMNYSIRSAKPPALKDGDSVVVAASLYEKRLMANSIMPAGDDMKKVLDLPGKLPLGWQIKDGKLVSPWNNWPADALGFKIDAIKDAGGRPAMTCGEGITLTVEKVIPKDVQQFQNPYGDGEFTITVTNTTKEDKVVQALLVDDGNQVVWPASLVIIDGQGIPRTLPCGQDELKFLKLKKLKAGESVSTTVNTLKIKGIDWPKGGSRVLLTFCLGELGQTDFFYYYSKRHDAMR